jgi:AraC-like DNA-binding protein
MDLLGSVLQSLRVLDTNLTLLALRAPYSFLIPLMSEDWVFLTAPLNRRCLIGVGGTQTWLEVGDVAVTIGSEMFMRSEPGLPAISILESWREQQLSELGPKTERRAPNYFTWGGGQGDSADRILGGGLLIDEVHRCPVLSVLPQFIVLRAGNALAMPWTVAALSFADEEARDPRPGYNLMARQLVSAWFTALIRAHALETNTDKAGWLRGIADPQIGRVLAYMHDEFHRRLRREEIAKACGMSATTLSRRFLELVGQPPMDYLCSVRMQAAAKMLTRRVPVSVVAQEVGYQSEWAFRKAFHSKFNTSPLAYARAMSD